MKAPSTQRRLAVLIATLGATTLASAARADDAPAAAPAQKVEKIVVTGSNIKRIGQETASPVTIMKREEIAQTGATNLREILDTLTSTNSELLDVVGNSWAAGATGASMRYLGKGATLTLLNGRRISNYGLADGAQQTFVNIDSIPAEVIDRVEILRDGASAIYGSDAIAGVINIITRQEFQGLSLSGARRQALKGGYDGRSEASLTAGVGDLSNDGYNVFGQVGLFHRDKYNARDIIDDYPQWHRDYVNPNVGVKSTYSWPGNLEYWKDGVVGGTKVVEPTKSCPASSIQGGLCRYDQWQDVELLPVSDRFTFFGSGKMNFSGGLRGFAEAQYYNDTDTFTYARTLLNSFGSPTYWYDAKHRTVKEFDEPMLPVGNAANPYAFPVGIRYRFTDSDQPRNQVKSSQYRVLAGLQGTLSAWVWEMAAGTMGSDVQARERGRRAADAFTQAVTSGAYVFGGKNDPALLAKMFPEYGSDGHTTQTFLDGKITGDLTQLPNGPLSVAAGFDFRHETFKMESTQNLQNAEIVGFGSTDVNGSRNISAAYAELNAPLLKHLELSAALRVDKSSNAKGSITPKLGLRYEVSDQLLLRGTYAEGFRAPNLPEDGQGATSQFTNSLQDPKRCATAQAMYDVLKNGNEVDKANALLVRSSGCSVSAGDLVVPNSGIQPEKAKSYTLGFVLAPTHNLSFGADYFHITRRNEIGTRDVTEILAEEDKDPSRIVRGNVTAFDQEMSQRVFQLSGQHLAFTSGQLALVYTPYENLYKTQVAGLDFDITGNWNLSGVGRLSSEINATYMTTLRYWDTTLNGYGQNRVGKRGVPRLGLVFKTSLSHGPWTPALRVTHYSGTSLDASEYDTQYSPDGCAASGVAPEYCQIVSDTVVDTSLAYTGIKNLRLGLNINNLFNRPLPPDITTGFTLRTRELKLSAEYRFF